MAKNKSDMTLGELKLKIIETRVKIAAGREKNVRAGKNLRRELAKKMSAFAKATENKE